MHQANLALKDAEHIGKQAIVASVRLRAASLDLTNHDRQIERRQPRRMSRAPVESSAPSNPGRSLIIGCTILTAEASVGRTAASKERAMGDWRFHTAAAEPPPARSGD